MPYGIQGAESDNVSEASVEAIRDFLFVRQKPSRNQSFGTWCSNVRAWNPECVVVWEAATRELLKGDKTMSLIKWDPFREFNTRRGWPFGAITGKSHCRRQGMFLIDRRHI